MSEPYDDVEVVERIKGILRASPKQEMPLAALGNRVAKAFDAPLRDLIGDRKLTELIQEKLGDQVVLSGPKDRLVATLLDVEPKQGLLTLEGTGGEKEAVPERAPSRKYDHNFWDAFIRPPRRNHLRAVDPKPPFSWADINSDIPPGWIAIDIASIPTHDQAWPIRKRAASAAIERWCVANGFNAEDFTEKNTVHRTEKAKSSGINNAGAIALLQMVEAVSENLRPTQTVNLSLIYSLLHEGR